MKLIKWFAGPGETMLVIGSGSGSEVIARIIMGLKVVAMEMDPLQFEFSKARIKKFVRFKGKPEDVDRAYADVERALYHKDEGEGKKKEKKLLQKSSSASSTTEAIGLNMDVNARLQPPSENACSICNVPATSARDLQKCCHCARMIHTISPSSLLEGGSASCGVICADCERRLSCSESCNQHAHPRPQAFSQEIGESVAEIPVESVASSQSSSSSSAQVRQG